MKQIRLTYHQRILIWNILGNFEAPRLSETATYLRVYEKVRPSDVELRESQYLNDGKSLHWNREFKGDRDIDFEDEEATALAKPLAAIKGPIRIVDAAWITALIKTLNPAQPIESDVTQPVETEVPQ